MYKLIQSFLNVFSCVATMIFIFSSIYIALFFGIKAPSYVWGVLAISLFAAIIRIPIFVLKEMSKVHMLIYNVVYFILINIAVLITGYYLEWFYLSNTKMVIGMEITIIIVSVCVLFIMHLIDLHAAEQMNEKLKSRNKGQNFEGL